MQDIFTDQRQTTRAGAFQPDPMGRAAAPSGFPAARREAALLRCDHAVEQTGLPDELIEQSFPSDQFGRRVKLGDTATIEDHDSVGIENGVDSMRNRDDGPVMEHVTPERRLQQSIRLDVNGSLYDKCQSVVRGRERPLAG